MVLLTSRLGHFTAAPFCSWSKSSHSRGHPFSRSYEVILQSSLTKGPPFTLVCSTRLPVSVCGTGTTPLHSLEAFLGSLASIPLSSPERENFHSVLGQRTDGFAYPCSLHHLRRSYRSRNLASCVPPLLITMAVVQEYKPVVHRLRPSATP